MIDKRKAIAIAILNYCKQKNLKFFTTRYEKKNMIDSKTGESYNEYQIAGGVRWLNANNKFKRVSKRRYLVISYNVK